MARIGLKVVQGCRVLFYRALSQGIITGQQPRRAQPLLISGKGRFQFGKGVQFGFWPSHGFLSGYAHIECRSEEARIVIGDDVFLNNGACLIAQRTSITIGDHCRIGPNVRIFDSDFHAVNPEERLASGEARAAAVEIGRNVFIGDGTTILKGVIIGEGSVVAAGSVVMRSVPPRSLVVGNPATIKRQL